MKLRDVIGQQHLIGPTGPIRKMLENKNISSMILHGPPGIGKTTIANIIANESGFVQVSVNGATSAQKDLSEALALVKIHDNVIIIIDEIHRLDKKKQDYLLPFLERDDLFIIGTTTENPYFDVSSAIRSRCIIFELSSISNEDLFIKLKYIFKERKYQVNDGFIEQLITIVNGDIRQALNLSDFLLKNYENKELTNELLKELFPNNVVYGDDDDTHHNLKSALQKSIRASDVNATIHYAARLMYVGDYKALLRRLLIIAYEDIGNANPQLCARVLSAIESFERVGMPEGRIVLGTIIIDMALSPKSPAAHVAFDTAFNDIEQLNISEINEYIKHNQKDEYKYDKELAKTLNLLPSSIKDKKYYYSENSSKYEQALYELYLRREEGVK
ncbi:MAG: AAA family ATPase [Mycoplasmatales bacterium]